MHRQSALTSPALTATEMHMARSITSATVMQSQRSCKSDNIRPYTTTQLATRTHLPHTVSLSRKRDPTLSADDDAHACRASICIGKLSGARLAPGGRLAGERLQFKAYRCSSRPPSSFWQSHRDLSNSSTSLKRPAVTTATMMATDSESSAAFSTTSCRPHRGRPAPRPHNWFVETAA